MTQSLKDLSFQALFDVAADAMLLIDATGHVVLANVAAQELLEYPEADICGLDVSALMPLRYRDHHMDFMAAYSRKPEQRAMGSGKVLFALRRDGQEISVDIALSPIHTKEQLFTLVTLYPTDRRRAAEEALRVSEERLRLAKQAAGLGVFDFDANHNVLHWDEKMRELWGAETNESVSYKRFLTAIHPDDRAARLAALDRAIDIAGNGEFNAEYRVTNLHDGSERWVSAIGQMHFEDGHATRLVGVARDITEHKSFEKKMQDHRAETETLFTQQVAAQTVSAIAHELNQPLAAISAYSEVALHVLESDTIYPDNLKRALKGCVEQSQRAGQSLHELLAFLQKGDLVKTRLNINEVVKEALGIAKNNGYGAFNPKLHLDPNIPLVIGNRIQIQKVLVNLLRNAVEAMRGAKMPSSPISITVRTNPEVNMAHVTVQDNGPGLDREIAGRVFEPFFTTKPTGIGMGLAISRALTEANGGQLWLDPDTSNGATFHFTIPFAP
ncbi:MAG: PAS domain-containing sensor histidine kinase [Pseudomonadota bacterium]